MLRMKATLLTALLALSFCQAEEVVISNYRLTLPEEYSHRPGRGMDTVVGSIVSADGKVEIKYDIGESAGNKLESGFPGDITRKETLVTQKAGAGTFVSGKSADGSAIAYFALPPHTNFYCEVQGKMPDAMREIMKSLRPKDTPPVEKYKDWVQVTEDADGKRLKIIVLPSQAGGPGNRFPNQLTVWLIDAVDAKGIIPPEKDEASAWIDRSRSAEYSIEVHARIHVPERGPQSYHGRITVDELLAASHEPEPKKPE